MSKETLAQLRALYEKTLAIGTVRTWGKDRQKFQKQRDGSWKLVTTGDNPASGGPAMTKALRARDKATPSPARSKSTPIAPKPVKPTPATPKVEIPVGRKWIDKVPGLPESTMDEHFKDGEPKPARKALHEHIDRTFSNHVKPVPPGKKPIALLTMGGPASGKSSIIKGVAKDDFVQVDPDAIKDMIPEYKEGVEKGARNAAFMAHDESSFIAKNIQDKAIEDNKNVIIDGTGKNAPKYLKLIADLKAKGYHVQLVMPHVPAEKGLARAKSRAEQTGRWVPEDVIKDAYDKIPGNFEKIAALADEAALFDTDRDPPKVVYEKKDGKEVDKDPDFMKKFRSTAKSETIMDVLDTLKALFEADEPESDDEKEVTEDCPPSFSLNDIVKRSIEGLKATKEPEGPAKFKKGEGVDWPLDDDHIG